ncbi:acetyltransferase [Riemerella columbina]|uniref:acetyltransferase n=1 Tax=Riemerella columbina TaxID=103810 RepID=UPI00266ED4E4|nr:acetyltransferase [Riemerella columbina]WKS94931.1 acetyltransferase [Riemerella columbina]
MILFGASGHCKVILDILQENKIEIEKIYDDNPKYAELLGISVVKNNLNHNDCLEAIISIGNNKIRKEISQKYAFDYFTAIHPKAVVSKASSVDKGTVIMANAVVNPDAKIGKHCIINTGAIIEHDCLVEDFVHISPNAALAGNVHIGEGTHIGIGASIIQGIKIGKWATIGAGSVVIRDVPDGATVVGNPAQILKIKSF